MGWGTQHGRDGHPVGQGSWRWTPSRTGSLGTGTQWGRVPWDGPSASQGPQGMGNGWGRDPGGLKTTQGTGTQGERHLWRGCPEPPDRAKTPIKAEHSLGQGTPRVGTGHLLETGCPQWWGTCWVEGTHGGRHGTHGDRTLLGDRGHPRGCSQVPPLPIGARRGRGCAQWTRLTATSARPAGSRSACRPA